MLSEKAEMAGFFGARGTGKSVSLVSYVNKKKAARLIVWDYKHDKAFNALPCRTYTNLREVILAMQGPRWKLRYLVDHDKDIPAQFDWICRAVWLAGDCLFVPDELGEVTKPGRAPPAWKKLVNVGREYVRVDGITVGVGIAAASQRPGECDLSFRANLDLVRTGRLAEEDDARTMAKRLGCDWRELVIAPDLAFIQRRVSDLAPTRGFITFQGGTMREHVYKMKNKAEPGAKVP